MQGNLTLDRANGLVLVGDPGDDGSGPNAISGNATIASDGGGVEIGHNRISGNLTLNGDGGRGGFAEDGAPEVEANTIYGTLNCSGDRPAATNEGQPSTVYGSRSGECAAKGF